MKEESIEELQKILREAKSNQRKLKSLEIETQVKISNHKHRLRDEAREQLIEDVRAYCRLILQKAVEVAVEDVHRHARKNGLQIADITLEDANDVLWDFPAEVELDVHIY